MVLKLLEKFQRPIISIGQKNISALLDTGAHIPVWTGSKYTLSYAYKAKKIKDSVEFKGFGGTAVGDLYQIPIFTLGDLVYPELPIVAVSSVVMPVQMILSATMFSNLIYEINDKDKFLNIKIPKNVSNIRHLEVKDSNGNLYILCTDSQKEEFK